MNRSNRKRLLVFVPNQPSVCHQLALGYTEAWMFQEAQATFSKLLAQSPQIALSAPDFKAASGDISARKIKV